MSTSLPSSIAANTEQPAGLWRQWVAMLYDSLLLLALFFIGGFALIAIFGEASELGETTIPPNLYRAVIGGIVVIFYGVFWLKNGQTLGMQAWRIRLMHENGGKITPGQVIVRLLAALVSWLPMGLGYWWSLWDPKRQTWHDRLSKTRVVRVPKTTAA